MTGFDAQQYELCKERVSNVGMVLKIEGDRFRLSSSTTGKNYGIFNEINDVWNFLCGYEACMSDR